MLTLGPLSFAFPAALLALLALPVLWWLLKVTPPAPKRLVFPPVRLLLRLIGREQQAVRTPPWLLLLRLLLALLLILAASRPVYDVGQGLAGSGPVVLFVDNGWAAAPGWRARQDAIAAALDAAEREGREVLIVPTAAAETAEAAPAPLLPLPAAKAREMASSLQPRPWATDRGAAVARIGTLANPVVLWLSDGLGEANGAGADEKVLADLAAIGPVRILRPAVAETSPLLRSDPHPGGALTATALRAGDEGSVTPSLRLIAENGSTLGREPLAFAAGSRTATVRLDLPSEWLQQLARLEIEGSESAGAVVLIDRRWLRRAVGIVGEADAVGEQPLLGRNFYLERALEPYAELRTGSINELLKRQLAMLVLADVGRLDPETTARVRAWVEEGGVLLRFAGPHLAEAAGGAPDPLLPVPLRPGDRTLGGALSWGEGGQLAPFDANGAFAGLNEAPDVRVHRQVLAEPTLDEASHTWARLTDGTPLITGSKVGAGWLVLVHTTANADWSNLALSGLFVEILRRIADLGLPGGGRADQAPLAPIETLDGFGRLAAPPKTARTIGVGELDGIKAGPAHPPGYYGRPDARVAVNLSPSLPDPRLLAPLPRAAGGTYGVRTGIDPLPALLAAALVLALIDLAVSLRLRGIIGRPSTPGAASSGPRPPRRPTGRRWRPVAWAAIALPLLASPSNAQTVVADGSAPAAALSTSLAYVITGDVETDRLSLAALTGLSAVVNRRTAAELAPPVGVRPDRDELSFYPLLYWPLVDPIAVPSPVAARQLAAYMRSGGTILFDIQGGRSLDDRTDLRAFARALDLPPLVPVESDNVLRRSYYLLSDLPGRFTGNTVWIEANSEHVNDGVSAVVAGANDWGGAWAVDSQLQPLKAVVPGGERQRELAYRFGVNLVMYVLTGNYKTDQVHLPAILDRLRSAPR